jgi:hypothetical protein
MSTQEDFLNEPPRKQGMSSTAKVLIVLGSIAGLCLLACCGGGIFVWFKAKDAIQNFAANFTTNNPEEIRTRTAKIVHIDVPKELPPMHAFDWFVMKQILYGNPNKGSMLMIMEVNQAATGAQGAKQQRDAMLQQLKQQQGQQPGNVNTDINEESSETREFTIDGEKVPFEFIKGTARGGTASRQVVGVFQGRQGSMIMLMLMVPESDYDEAAVVRMLESIRLPGDDMDDESTSGSEMHELPEKGDATAPDSDDDSAPAADKKLDEKDSGGDATSGSP